MKDIVDKLGEIYYLKSHKYLRNMTNIMITKSDRHKESLESDVLEKLCLRMNVWAAKNILYQSGMLQIPKAKSN